jgi:Galactose oxidase, central domain
VHVLDTDTWRWHRPALEGTGPCPRSGAACLLQDGRLYIFGGSVKGARMNDLWTLDLSSFLWREIVTSGNAPSPRQLASMCYGGEFIDSRPPALSPCPLPTQRDE